MDEKDLSSVHEQESSSCDNSNGVHAEEQTYNDQKDKISLILKKPSYGHDFVTRECIDELISEIKKTVTYELRRFELLFERLIKATEKRDNSINIQQLQLSDNVGWEILDSEMNEEHSNTKLKDQLSSSEYEIDSGTCDDTVNEICLAVPSLNVLKQVDEYGGAIHADGTDDATVSKTKLVEDGNFNETFKVINGNKPAKQTQVCEYASTSISLELFCDSDLNTSDHSDIKLQIASEAKKCFKENYNTAKREHDRIKQPYKEHHNTIKGDKGRINRNHKYMYDDLHEFGAEGCQDTPITDMDKVNLDGMSHTKGSFVEFPVKQNYESYSNQSETKISGQEQKKRIDCMEKFISSKTEQGKDMKKEYEGRHYLDGNATSNVSYTEDRNRFADETTNELIRVSDSAAAINDMTIKNMDNTYKQQEHVTKSEGYLSGEKLNDDKPMNAECNTDEENMLPALGNSRPLPKLNSDCCGTNIEHTYDCVEGSLVCWIFNAESDCPDYCHKIGATNPLDQSDKKCVSDQSDHQQDHRRSCTQNGATMRFRRRQKSKNKRRKSWLNKRKGNRKPAKPACTRRAILHTAADQKSDSYLLSTELIRVAENSPIKVHKEKNASPNLPDASNPLFSNTVFPEDGNVTSNIGRQRKNFTSDSQELKDQENYRIPFASFRHHFCHSDKPFPMQKYGNKSQQHNQQNYLQSNKIFSHHQARGELGCGKFNYQVVSRKDSGIESFLSSLRSSILSDMESYQNLLQHQNSCSSRRKSKVKKQTMNHFLKLGLLEAELAMVTKQFWKNISFRNVDPNIVAFPGLQPYFDSLSNGVTLSLQERMAYEWLRLMSFSAYNGGGSPVHLARGGFYHHHGSETRCFCCNVSYSEWQYTDNVQAVHRRISPNCPFMAGGMESNGNISIEPCNTESQSRPTPENLASTPSQQSVATQSVSNSERHYVSSSVSHGGFSFGSAPGINLGGQPGIAGRDPRFSFYSNTSAASSPQFSFSQTAGEETRVGDVTSQVTGQLGALTIQQSAGAQQPTEEPVSGNPLIVPTQPSQIARQTDGDAQLIVSAQQQPEANDTQQNTAGNQGTSEASSSRPPPSGTESADILPIGALKHPRYGSLNVRMSSFASWPSYLNQTPRQMAYAGFFHPGVADFARCFCCGGGLRNWEADDDPMVEHARWYPRCEYINKLKGTHFVQAVLRRHREHMAERQREQERPADNTFTSPDPMTTEVAASLLEMGFNQERAREAILTVRRLRGRTDVTAEEVTAWMLDDDNAPQSEPTRAGDSNGMPQGTVKGAVYTKYLNYLSVDTAGARDTVGSEDRSEERNVSASSSGSGSSEPTVTTQSATSGNTESSTETQGAAGGGDKQVETKTTNNKDKTDVDSSADETAGSGKSESSTSGKSKSKKGKKSKSRKDRSPAGEGATSSHGDVDTKSLKEENKLLKQMQVCKICMDKYVSVTFLPCGHLVCCEECAKSMRKCPICRKRIKGQVKTFMS